MTKDEAVAMGFVEIPHRTIGDNLTYELGSGRHLSIGCIGTPNEMVIICQEDRANRTVITDAVTLHNYDYHGYLTAERLQYFMGLKDTQNEKTIF